MSKPGGIDLESRLPAETDGVGDNDNLVLNKLKVGKKSVWFSNIRVYDNWRVLKSSGSSDAMPLFLENRFERRFT